ncbi:MAG: DUF2782 domain-containing protein [Zetaproteobacteria bacterium]|nr:DUF2782 domain-containing protein [Zetaproteobacteria bacterium]
MVDQKRLKKVPATMMWPLIPCMMVVGAWVMPIGAEAGALPPPEQLGANEPVQNLPEASQSDDIDLSQPFEPSNADQVEVRSDTREDGSKITEYSVNGHTYMIRVEPMDGLPAYYLYDSNGDGVFEQRLPGGYKRTSPPMWVIKKF